MVHRGSIFKYSKWYLNDMFLLDTSVLFQPGRRSCSGETASGSTAWSSRSRTWLQTSYNSSTWLSLSVLDGLGESNRTSNNPLSCFTCLDLEVVLILSGKIETCFYFHLQKSHIPPTLGPLIHAWFKSTNTIPWVQVIIYSMSSSPYHEFRSVPWVF